MTQDDDRTPGSAAAPTGTSPTRESGTAATVPKRAHRPEPERFVGEYRLLEVLPAWGCELALPQGSLWRAEHVLSRQTVVLGLLEAIAPSAASSEVWSDGSSTAPDAGGELARGSRLAVWDRAARLSHIDHHGLTELVESRSPGRSTAAPRDGESSAPQAGFHAWMLDQGPTLRERWMAKQPLRTVEALRVVQHVAEGLAEIHGLDELHGCLAPANVLLTPIGARLIAAGFGPFQHHDLPGTLPALGWIYRAPEQLLAGGGPIGPAADLWTLGVMLWEIVFGEPPSIPIPQQSLDDTQAPQRALGELREALRQFDVDALLAAEADAPGGTTMPDVTIALLGQMLQRDPRRRPRADEVATTVHQAVRALADRAVARGAALGTARSTPTSSSEPAPRPGPAETATSSGSAPRLDDWRSTSSWLRQRRAEFAGSDSEEEETPTWLLWILPAAIFLVFAALLVVLVLLR